MEVARRKRETVSKAFLRATKIIKDPVELDKEYQRWLRIGRPCKTFVEWLTSVGSVTGVEQAGQDVANG